MDSPFANTNTYKPDRAPAHPDCGLCSRNLRMHSMKDRWRQDVDVEVTLQRGLSYWELLKG